MAIGHKTGGRKKGTPNKATAAKEAAISESGLTPLDYLLMVMRDTGQPDDVRRDAAKAAAPYVHPRRAAIEHSGSIDTRPASELTDAELSDIARSGSAGAYIEVRDARKPREVH
jgi:hypothetical protein